MREVSVPLRGLVVLIRRHSNGGKVHACVSVPLRGLVVFNRRKQRLEKYIFSFRPLTGISCF